MKQEIKTYKINKKTYAVPISKIERGSTIKIKTGVKCNRCGYISKNKVAMPKRCPACFSPLWNVKRTYKIKPENRAKKRTVRKGR